MSVPLTNSEFQRLLPKDLSPAQVDGWTGEFLFKADGSCEIQIKIRLGDGTTREYTFAGDTEGLEGASALEHFLVDAYYRDLPTQT